MTETIAESSRARRASSEQRPGPRTPGKGARRVRSRTSLVAEGQPLVWLTGGSLFVCVAMILGMLILIVSTGLGTFWPQDVVLLRTLGGEAFMGEVTRAEEYRPDEFVFEDIAPEQRERARAGLDEEGIGSRRLVRTGNYRLTQNHFVWVDDFQVAEEERPEWAVVLERTEWGRFYGFPEAFVLARELDRKRPDGAPKSRDELREETRVQLSSFVPEHGGEARILVEREVAGEPMLMPAASEELEETTPFGVAEVVVGPERTWELYGKLHDEVWERRQKRHDLEKYDVGAVNHVQETARLALREAELELDDALELHDSGSPEVRAATERVASARSRFEEKAAWAESEFGRIRALIDDVNEVNGRYRILFRTAGEGASGPVETIVPLDEIVRGYPANRLGTTAQLGIYLSRWGEFLSAEPREANSEGGVFPAIFGTVAMTLIMAIAVVPFGVLAALYLREYAKAGPIVSAVRIAVNNLAGVPSIVFGVFGLGFFCYALGTNLDELFFRAELPSPTFGKGGLMWASLTLALLTLPVVIVATEEALSAVPNSMREGSYACGASKWQTIKRIVLPRAMPGIMTGMILAMARGAGEVAPLMLVGAVKLAPELPIDGLFPYVHPQRSFMHLGFHIFDVGFQSQNSEAAKPMVYTTTLLLITIIFLLNVVAIALRKRLSRRFESGAV